MYIRYERPISDLSFLVNAPLRLDVGDGRTVTVARWNLDGIEPPLSLEGPEGVARLTIPFNGFEISFDVHLRRDSDNDFMRFVDLGQREDRLLRHFYREVISGRAEAVDQIICSMDIPVDPVPMQQTPEESRAMPQSIVPRPMRAAAIITLYLALGAMLYGPVITPVWSRVAEIASAPASTAPKVTATAPAPPGSSPSAPVVADKPAAEELLPTDLLQSLQGIADQ